MSWRPGNRYGRSRTEVIDEDGNAVATVWTHRDTDDRNVTTPDERAIARLRLIVAAPDMRDLLKDCRRYLTSFGCIDPRELGQRIDDVLASIEWENFHEAAQ